MKKYSNYIPKYAKSCVIHYSKMLFVTKLLTIIFHCFIIIHEKLFLTFYGGEN